MTDHTAIDLEAIRSRYCVNFYAGKLDPASKAVSDLIAAVEALRERVARLTGCKSLDCPECGEASKTDRAACEVCGAHLSLKNFNGIIKQIDADWRHSTELAEAHATELAGALKFILAFYDPSQTHLDTEAWKCAEAGGRTALAAFLANNSQALERAKAKDEILIIARSCIDRDYSGDPAIAALDVAFAKLDALDQEDGAPPLCDGCGKYPADPPSHLCPGCQAYQEHQS